MDYKAINELTKQVTRNPDLRVLEKELKKVREFEEKYKNLSYEQIGKAIEVYRKKVKDSVDKNSVLSEEEQDKKNKAVLNSLLPEVYALVSILFSREKNIKIADTQIMTSIALNYDSMVELGTGEGKTYSGTFVSVLNSLMGKGVHVVTSNNYLAKRDYEDLRGIFEHLGITSSYIEPRVSEDDLFIMGEEEKAATFSRKRELYNCDICFGSSSTFVFDYLHDSLAKKGNEIVQRPEAPFFALIDEADDILFDQARTSFIISAPAKIYKKVNTYDKDKNPCKRDMNVMELSLMLGVDIEDMIRRSNALGEFDKPIERKTLIPYDDARTICEKLYGEELLPDTIPLQQRIQDFITNYLVSDVYNCSDVNKFSWSKAKLFNHLSDNPYNQRGLTSSEVEWLVNIRDKHPLVLGTDTENNPKYALTSDGKIKRDNYFFFCYLQENPELLDEVRDPILFSTLVKKGREFSINKKTGKIDIEPDRIGFMCENVPELRRIKDNYLISQDYSLMSAYLEIGLRANFELEEGKDYFVSDLETEGKSAEVKLIIAGRAEDGRAFSDGLQEALVLKERKKKVTDSIKLHPQTKTNASTSAKAYFARYSKKAGMTGTAPHEGYVAKLYDGMYVVKMVRTAIYNYARNKAKKGEEPILTRKSFEKFTITDEEKYELILKSIAESRNSNPRQPVLITTTSLEKSEALAKYIEANGDKYGVPKPTLLNAKKDPDYEAVIISMAGIPGAVTISTEMAGRGTDIKLGGDRDKILEYYLNIFYEEEKITEVSTEQRLNDMSLLERGLLLKKSITPGMTRAKLNELLEKELESHNSSIGRIVKDVEEARISKKLLMFPYDQGLIIPSKEAQEKSREKLKGVGLKVILSGHFMNGRIDAQAEGRQNRRGYDGGDVQCFSSKQDLYNIGINPRLIDPLLSLHCMKNLSDKLRKDSYRRIIKLIFNAQKNNDEALFKQIEQTQDLDLLSASYRSKIRTDKMSIVTGLKPEGLISSVQETKIDYKEKMDFLIDETIRFIIISNIRGDLGERELKMTPRQIGLYEPSGELTKDRFVDLSDRSMDGARFVLEIEGTIGGLLRDAGVSFHPNTLSKFSTVEKMINALSLQAKKGLVARKDAMGEESFNELCKSLYTSIYDKSSEASLEVATDVQVEDRIYKSMQNQGFSPVISFINSMNGVMRGFQQDVVGFNFGRKFDKANRDIFDSVREAKINRSQSEAYLSDENRRVIDYSTRSINISDHAPALLSNGKVVFNRGGRLFSKGGREITDYSSETVATSHVRRSA